MRDCFSDTFSFSADRFRKNKVGTIPGIGKCSHRGNARCRRWGCRIPVTIGSADYHTLSPPGGERLHRRLYGGHVDVERQKIFGNPKPHFVNHGSFGGGKRSFFRIPIEIESGGYNSVAVPIRPVRVSRDMSVEIEVNRAFGTRLTAEVPDVDVEIGFIVLFAFVGGIERRDRGYDRLCVIKTANSLSALTCGIHRPQLFLRRRGKECHLFKPTRHDG